MALADGVRLGPYEILSPLGLAAWARSIARAIAALNHPHICTLHDVGLEDGVDFLVLEYLEGDSLAGRLAHGARDGSPMRIDDILRYAIEVSSALDKAQSAGIIHRDLKPANVFLTKTGSKLLDFGLAKTAPAAPIGTASTLPTTAPALTQTGTLLGTFQYMAPEQLEGRDADARGDDGRGSDRTRGARADWTSTLPSAPVNLPVRRSAGNVDVDT